MREVQEALTNIGIPVMAGIWRATDANQNTPPQYVIYSSSTWESDHSDDVVTDYKSYVYMNLWSETDPTDMAKAVRTAMYDYGFVLVEESDKGYNQPAYDAPLRLFTVSWTWCLHRTKEEYEGA